MDSAQPVTKPQWLFALAGVLVRLDHTPSFILEHVLPFRLLKRKEPVGVIRSTVKRREDAPRQRPEGAPDAWLEIEPRFAEALLGIGGAKEPGVRYY